MLDCRMGAVTPFSVVDGPEAWTAADYQDRSKFTYTFNESDIAELDSAIAAVQERGSDIKVGTQTNADCPDAQCPLEVLRDG